MSFAKAVNIAFHQNKNCFVSIPREWIPSISNRGQDIIVFKIQAIDESEDSTKGVFVSWNGEFTRTPTAIEINSILANKFGFKLNDQVLVTIVKPPTGTLRECLKATVQPLTSYDYEFVCLNWAEIERGLLNQIRIVWAGLAFPIWVPGANLVSYLKVIECEPSNQENTCEPLVLAPFTELVVLQDELDKKSLPSPTSETFHKPEAKPKVMSFTRRVGGFTDLLRQCQSFIRYRLRLDPLTTQVSGRCPHSLGGLLVCGPKGSGKSTLIESVCDNIRVIHENLHVATIDCKQLRGKRIESIQKLITKSFNECLQKQPSILIFEDLDLIAASADRIEQEMGAEGLYFQRVALIFTALIKALKGPLVERDQVTWLQRVVVIASSKSIKSLHPHLTSSRGSHIFGEIVEIKLPTLDQRAEMLKSLLQSLATENEGIKYSSEINFLEIAKKCEGFSPLDLKSVVQRTIHCYITRKVSSSSSSISSTSTDDSEEPLSTNDFIQATEGFVPYSLRGMDLSVKTNKRLSDVGGLAEAKKRLQNCLLLPTKYPRLYSLCPLRPQSCLLLYGAPGTGKTLLAEAIAGESGLNFISIKGPELLSKYIGASEAAVRDLFIRASAAKPCIIFFDEFDSIAPRRGHDSTGVTDRVVNQLLTQMDGVEGLEKGVYILAATSRPDLLDPALLRPGRFDECIYCPLPDEKERYEILTALTSRLQLAQSVDLKKIAAQTKFFTGADLQAILYLAQLEALHESIDNSPSNPSLSTLNQQFLTDSSIKSEFISFTASEESSQSNRLELNQIAEELEEIKINLSNAHPLPSSSMGQGEWQGSTSTINEERPESRNNVEEQELDSKPALIKVEERHFLKAISSTIPSVKDQDRRRYEKLYESFAKNKAQDFGGNELDPKILAARSLKKVTLA